MAKVRVYELAKELNVNSKDLVVLLQKLGVEAKNHMSIIEESLAQRIRERVAALRSQAKPAASAAGPAERVTVQPREVKPEPPQQVVAAPQKPTRPVPDKARPATREVAERPSLRAIPGGRVPAQERAEREGLPPRRPEYEGRKGARPGAPYERVKKGLVAPPPPQAAVKERRRPRREEKEERWEKDWEEVQPERRLKPRKEERKKVAAPKEEVRGTVARKAPVVLPRELTVKELASRLAIESGQLMKKLLELGVLATINQQVDPDVAQLVAEELGFQVEWEASRDPEELYLKEEEDKPELLEPRPPVVTIMGHVDHGKTSLLDAIRETRVTAQEAGGITQHIGAYQVELRGKRITFLDTPGHEAFTAMRARGAQVTDLAVLVVAADDGVMPQTVEAINHARAAGVPILVAINKIDKPNAQPERVKQELTKYGLVAEEWGGDTIFVNVSALRRQGIDELLEMILLLAEMRELRANPHRPARGVVIEAQLDKGRGPVATVLIQKGTLKVGDAIVAGAAAGKVRAMLNDKGKRLKKATSSMPVQVLGLSDVPRAGDPFAVVEDEKAARLIAQSRRERSRLESLAPVERVSLDDLFAKVKEGKVKSLNIVLKGDVQGSIEALQPALERLSTEEVRVNTIHAGVGAISESDVMLASASNAIIIGFNVRADANAKRVAERERVDIRLYQIIYDAINDVKAAIQGMLAPQYREVSLGRAEVRAIFRVPKQGVVAGSYVLEGHIERGASVRILRDNVVIQEDRIVSLRRFKDDVREVAAGYECGIGLEKFQDIKEGDLIEAYQTLEVTGEA